MSWHLGRFAAEQDAAVLAAGAGHAFDDRGRDVGFELSGRKIIEEKQRPRTLDQNVVDAVIYEIGTDRVVNAGLERQLELCPDAVRRRDQYRLRHIRKRPGKHPAKAADLGQRPLVKGAAGVFADLRDGEICVVDRDTGVGV